MILSRLLYSDLHAKTNDLLISIINTFSFLKKAKSVFPFNQ